MIYVDRSTIMYHRDFGALSINQNHMIQIIIKQIEFFVNPELIPSQRNEVSQKIFLLFIKNIFEQVAFSLSIISANKRWVGMGVLNLC